MSYTRRSVLRNAALFSIAGAAGASPMSLLGERSPVHSYARVARSFNPGIRIFFSGAWLFGVDPDNAKNKTNNMLAVTVDMCTTNPPCHKYVYGVWHPGGTFDSGPSLAPIRQNGNYVITFDTVNKPYSQVDKLFSDANNPTTSFLYFPNPKDGSGKTTLSIDTTKPTVRAISIPFPTSIIPAAPITNASIGDPSNRLQTRSAPNSMATTHIFNYEAASSMTLANGAGDVLDMASQDNNYHFHTVPISCADYTHAPLMFQALMGLIRIGTTGNNYVTDVTLAQNKTPTYSEGAATPGTVSDEELEIPPPGSVPAVCSGHGGETIMDQHLASCASGGGGVGDGG
jgi:hypothetical protein